MTSTTADTPPRTQKRSDTLLKCIAIFKFVKALSLIATGLAALKLLNPDTLSWVEAWTENLPLHAEQHLAQHLLGIVSGLGPHRIKELGLGAFLFAGIFSIEGTGLWLGRTWAEWFSVIATGVFIPIEIWELFDGASISKATVLLLNILVVAYLAIRIRKNRRPA